MSIWKIARKLLDRGNEVCSLAKMLHGVDVIHCILPFDFLEDTHSEQIGLDLSRYRDESRGVNVCRGKCGRQVSGSGTHRCCDNSGNFAICPKITICHMATPLFMFDRNELDVRRIIDQ